MPFDHLINAYLTEYQECMESYRHTYQTIWSAGAIFSAISAAMIALQNQKDYVLLLSPLPLIFWYVGIFLPMNRYGELRSARLKTIEETLNNLIRGLQMNHFITYHPSRKISFLEIFQGKWGVHTIVSIFGISLIIIQICLFYWYISIHMHISFS